MIVILRQKIEDNDEDFDILKKVTEIESLDRSNKEKVYTLLHAI